MSQGTLTIYNASAGSGKTYTLTGIYLSSLFRSRYNYRKILAVTFTNKATAEMKSRILDNLYKLSTGDKSEYLNELIIQSGQNEEWIREEAGKILNLILHDFSRFSVSTIDSFFQTILRAFSREAGLHSGYNVELDNEIWLSAAVDETISAASGDKQLRDWLISYAISNIDNEKSWNLKNGIMHLSRELFSEKFRLLSEKEMDKLGDKKFLSDYAGKMRQIEYSFINYMREAGRKAAELVGMYGLTDEMFYRKGQGIPRYLRLLAAGEIVEPNCYVREILDDPPRWSTGRIEPQLKEAITAGLDELLRDSIAYSDRNIVAYRTSKAISANIYALGILTDIMKNIHTLTSSENTFLLSDAGEFLRLITEADQCPFIYEKVGNTFENFMIDEFQDTSMVQWKNFYPLISNSMAQGFDNLVVGDIKQSIYRWRNSDWKILRTLIANGEEDPRIITNPLTVNFRSRSNIIRFNNALFSALPAILDEKIGNDSLTDRFDSLYSEAVQQDPGRKEGGYVRIEFVESGEENWEQLVLAKLPSVIESLQDRGYSASDTGIIVRDGRQGAMVLKCIADYANSRTIEQKTGYNYNIFSNDSLLLSGSAVVNFIISVLAYLNDPSDMVSKAAVQSLYSIAAADGDENPVLPDDHEDFLMSLTRRPLFESIEQIILFFGLGKPAGNTAWITTFQDCVLGFINSGNPDLKSFLQWWDTTGCRKSVILPGNQDAIRILTIHKSKGLEFSAVIIPFISWPLDHPSLRQPLLWVKPEVAPFSELGIVPVKCSKELSGTIFSQHYYDEKYSIYLDNLNLLYVAATRAKDVLYGFAPSGSGNGNIGAALRDCFCSNENFPGKTFNKETNIYEFGEIPACVRKGQKQKHSVIKEYPVTYASKSLKLKLHGENYFSDSDAGKRKRINYGKIMHEVFEGIDTASDIPGAVRKLVLEGKLPADEAPATENRIKILLNHAEVAPWFSPDMKVLKEAAILLTSGNIRRPDRVIFKDGKTIIIDFKFGFENDEYREQLNLYRSIIMDMGYNEVEAYIWYVDRNKIVSV